jgi:aspartyl-tRNA(Asn)/glutamyl-tRNA(Gln) amidotransferase subunit B
VQITDEVRLTNIVEEVVKENQEAVNDFKKGKKEALSFLVGQVMKKTKGKASPQVVNRLLKERIGSL